MYPPVSGNRAHHHPRWCATYSKWICYECSLFGTWSAGQSDILVLWPCPVHAGERVDLAATKAAVRYA